MAVLRAGSNLTVGDEQDSTVTPGNATSGFNVAGSFTYVPPAVFTTTGVFLDSSFAADEDGPPGGGPSGVWGAVLGNS